LSRKNPTRDSVLENSGKSKRKHLLFHPYSNKTNGHLLLLRKKVLPNNLNPPYLPRT
jgi:hypothetical protein